MSRPLLRALLLALVCVCLCVAAMAWLIHRDYRAAISRPLPIAEQGYRLLFEPGTSLRGLGRQLQADGLLVHSWYLRALVRERGIGNRLQAGEYQLPPGSSMQDLLALLMSGRVVQREFTIVEGWTVQQMLTALRAAPHLRWDLGDQPVLALAEVLEEPGIHPEGQFLPETYFYTRDMPASKLLGRAHRALTSTLARAWDARAADLPYETAYQALVMASIIEKETAVPAERAEIAGVFVRRLRLGMRLQTDPTVIYGLGADFDGNLRRVDLETETPYNTYRIKGLPPTPIALAGREAIQAAVQPAAGEALYFVSRGDGTHVFSRTLAEHNRAVRRYQLGESD